MISETGRMVGGEKKKKSKEIVRQKKKKEERPTNRLTGRERPIFEQPTTHPER